MKLRIATALAFIIALSACKKDNIENFPHVLKFIGISKKSDVRIYINGGVELKDKAAINKYLANWAALDNANNKPYDLDVITFTSKDSITFGKFDLKYSVQRKKDQYLFYSEYPLFIGFENVVDPYVLYTSEIIPVDQSSGYPSRRKDVRVAYGNNNNIKLSILQYKIARSNGNSYSMAMGYVFNEFSTSNLSSLQQGDTLAVQEFTINYKN